MTALRDSKTNVVIFWVNQCCTFSIYIYVCLECISLLGLLWKKYHRLGGLHSSSLFSHNSGAGSPRSSCWQDWFPVRPLSLPCRWPPPHCVLTAMWLFLSACTHASSFSYKDTNHIQLESTFMTSLKLNCLFKDPISKCTHILKYWELGFQHKNLLGRHNSVHNREEKYYFPFFVPIY